MAESGCLHTSSLNTLDVSDGVICESFKGGNLFIPESDPIVDYSGFEVDGSEGDILSLNESTDLPTGTHTFTVDIDWPKGSFIQDMSFMFTDKNPTGDPGDASLTIAATDALFIKIDALKGDTAAGIMDHKRIAVSNPDVAITIWKNVPINFIQCSTGIIGDTDVAIEQMAAGIKHGDNNFNDPFTILDPSSAWTNGTTDGYPLYNPSDTTNRRDKVRVTFTRAAKAPGAAGAAANFGGNELKLKLMVICTYMKVDLVEINNPS